MKRISREYEEWIRADAVSQFANGVVDTIRKNPNLSHAQLCEVIEQGVDAALQPTLSKGWYHGR